MAVADLHEISLKLNGVTEDIKWGDHLCLYVGGKKFLVTSPDYIPSTASFKVREDTFNEIVSMEEFSKHSHLGRHNWIYPGNINRLNAEKMGTSYYTIIPTSWSFQTSA